MGSSSSLRQRLYRSLLIQITPRQLFYHPSFGSELQRRRFGFCRYSLLYLCDRRLGHALPDIKGESPISASNLVTTLACGWRIVISPMIP